MSNQKQGFNQRAARRELYLGENIRAFFTTAAGESVGGEIISLSESGMAFVCDPKFDSEIKIDNVYQLKVYYDARNSFVTPVDVRNKSPFQSQGVEYIRIGVAAHASDDLNEGGVFETKLDGLIPLSKSGLGFVEIENPIFFDEKKYFKMRGVHPKGVVLEPLDNRHFLLPMQPIPVKFSLPGVKVFQEEMIVTKALPKQGKWANDLLLVDFVNANDKLLMKFAIYILIQEQEISVRKLQKSGFPIPFLDFILNVENSQNGAGAAAVPASLQKSVIAPYNVRLADLSSARNLSFYRQGTLIASMKLNFVKDIQKNSALAPLGAYNHQFHRRTVVELLEFSHHPEYPLPSILVPILQHCILSAIQAKFAFLVIECTAQTEGLFQRLGFISLPKKNQADDDEQRFVALGIQNGLYNMNNGIHRDTWERVYKRLYSYLAKKYPQTKQIA